MVPLLARERVGEEDESPGVSHQSLDEIAGMLFLDVLGDLAAPGSIELPAACVGSFDQIVKHELAWSQEAAGFAASIQPQSLAAQVTEVAGRVACAAPYVEHRANAEVLDHPIP
jgi:hypothetical protein